ncbi:MAG: nucleotide exchange factor GrpE [Thermodesulfobacteriota bacterium]
MKKDKTGKDHAEETSQTDGKLPVEEGGQAEKRDRVGVRIEVKTDKPGEKAEESAPEKEMDPIAQLQEALETVKKEKEELNDRFLRSAAEFDNYKKRLDRQWADFKKYANESLVRELLGVVDNLERAIVASAENAAINACIIDGVKMTLDEILKVLDRFGVKPIKAAGEKFDPNFHQAVSTRKADDVEGNVVLEEYQKGYLIHDRLLRPAMVVVSASE